MSRAVAYLQIPEPYCEPLGGLRWSIGGDAVDDPSGAFFAFNREIALFLEGMASGGELIHFGFVLHLLQLLGYGERSRFKTSIALIQEYNAAGRPLRHAGAFCSALCQGVPRVSSPPDPAEVVLQLTSGAVLSEVGAGAWAVQSDGLAVWRVGPGMEDPPLSPSAFLKHVLEALTAYSREEIRSWLRTGRGPIKGTGEQLARELEARRPKSLGEVLESLVERPRLVGAGALVSRLSGALSLPPRRLMPESLPLGGYGDVATRGHPERLLPSQHALDITEFLRRFTENELLYFHREEPNAPETEELVVLLDQGVRTWGDVRLVLGAAVVALGRLADRRGLSMRLAATSNDGRLVDPLDNDPKTVGELLEASDLSAHPGLALERLLEQAKPGPRRDVVLLSHPRNIIEPDVSTAALRAGPGTRMFALAVDDRGFVEFSALRHGRPVKLAAFRVDWPVRSATRSMPPEPAPSRYRDRPWVGDVEPIGFPFRFGLVDRPDRPRFAFDIDGEHLLLAGSNGLLHCWSIETNDLEILPRGMVRGQVLRQIDAVLGVGGGFVVAGRVDDRLAAVHYRLLDRRVKVYVPGVSTSGPWPWVYFQDLHAVATLGEGVCLCLGLALEQIWWSNRPAEDSQPAQVAMARMQGMGAEPPPALQFLHDDDTLPAFGPWLRLRRDSGAIELQGTDLEWGPAVPLADGLPMLAGCRIERAMLRGNCLALVVSRNPSSTRRIQALYLFRGPKFTLLNELPAPARPEDIALSVDGRLLAMRRRGERDFEIRETAATGPPLWVAPKGGAHQRIDLILGLDGFDLSVGRHLNRVSWGHGRLEIEGSTGPGKSWTDLSSRLNFGSSGPGIARVRPFPDWTFYDSRRFLTFCGRGGLLAVVDRFGQVVLTDRTGKLISMFFAFRGRVAAWLPDGTRLGPPEFLGGPPTPGAAEAIGFALLQASKDPTGAPYP
ncbi:hypothetical protein BH23PLA1_BH23PLA1_18920 [soil metagenome]